MKAITAESAWRLRRNRGVILSPDGIYESERLSEIAKRQFDICKEMTNLDAELESLAKAAGYDEVCDRDS